jgi:hypothetical protein
MPAHREIQLHALCVDRVPEEPRPERGMGLAQQDLVAWMYILPAPTLQFMNESTDGARIAFRAKIS